MTKNLGGIAAPLVSSSGSENTGAGAASSSQVTPAQTPEIEDPLQVHNNPLAELEENSSAGEADLNQAQPAQSLASYNSLQVHHNPLADIEQEEEEMTQLSDPPKYKGESARDDLERWVADVEAWWYSSLAVHTATLTPQKLWEVLSHKAFPFRSPAREWFQIGRAHV